MFKIQYQVKSSPQPLSININLILSHLLEELNQTTNGTSLSNKFISDFINITNIDKMVLFLWDNEVKHFIYNAASNATLHHQYENIQLPKQTSIKNSVCTYYPISKWNGSSDPGIQTILSITDVKDLFVIELFYCGTHFGIMLLWCPAFQQKETRFIEEVVEVANIGGRLVYDLLQCQVNNEEEKQYRLLYQITKKFHSSMDTKDILGEVIQTIHQQFPSFTCHLILNDSDNYNHKDLPVKPLNMSIYETNVTAAEAYITGQLQINDDPVQSHRMIYAPLHGRQGVYGVLEVSAPLLQFLRLNKIKFISELANTAGNALENVKLYQQSQKFIDDLKLINRTSHQLNSNLRLKDIITYMKGQIIESFHADEVGFFIFKPTFSILPGSSTFFLHEKQSDSFLNKTMNQILSGEDYLFSVDLANENEPNSIPYQSLMAVPMVQNKNIIGMIVALHKDPYAFTFDSFKLLQSIVHHSTLAFMNSMLREELEHLVNTDHLTQMNTRKYLDRSIEKSLKSDLLGLFMLIDIDNFKAINDTFGHQVGDRILIQVAELIKQNLRECDTAARWGGEELAIYFPNITLEIGKQIADQLLIRVKEETNPKVTISCGIATWSKDYTQNNSIETLFKHADNALYLAKTAGKNRLAY